MIDPASVVALAVVAIGLVLTPGPNMLYLVSRSTAQGWRAGMISLAGVSVGFGTYLTTAVVGLGAVFATVPTVYLALKSAGAAYLMCLAWKPFRSGSGSMFAPAAERQDGAGRLFRTGVLTCLLNPKIAILYVSLLPQFIDPARGHVALQTALLGMTQIVVGVSVNALIVLTAHPLAAFLAARPIWARAHAYLTGTLLVAFAARILVAPLARIRP
jgi:threonine/homoserine/homoserine lactone efflux protein